MLPLSTAELKDCGCLGGDERVLITKFSHRRGTKLGRPYREAISRSVAIVFSSLTSRCRARVDDNELRQALGMEGSSGYTEPEAMKPWWRHRIQVAEVVQW